MLNAIIFDVNDTLTFSTWKNGLDDFILACLNEYSKIDPTEFRKINTKIKKNISKKDKKDKYYSDWMTFTINEYSDYLGLNLDVKEKTRILNKIDHYITENTHTLTGTYKLLERLHNDYPLYVITNSSKRVRKALKKLKLDKFFKDIFISEESGRIKENGEIFKDFIQTTKLDPNKCLMIGDKLKSDGKCKTVGMLFCLVDKDNKSQMGDYDFKVNSIDEVYSVINKLNKLV